MLSDKDHAYFFQRAETELAKAQRSSCAPAARVHGEMAERYMALCGGMTTPADAAARGRQIRR